MQLPDEAQTEGADLDAQSLHNPSRPSLYALTSHSASPNPPRPASISDRDTPPLTYLFSLPETAQEHMAYGTGIKGTREIRDVLYP